MEVQRVNIDAAVLLADVVGSTPLYESAGNDIALGQIAEWRERLCALVRSNGGEFISSKGDDVLSIFSDAAGAFRAASHMRAQRRHPISFHAGLHYGPIIRVGNDIYGDAVNMTARLASIANPGEVIMSQNFVDLLATDERQSLSSLDKMTFKGKSRPCNIYTFLDEDRSLNTQISIGRTRASATQEATTCAVYVTLRYNGQTMCCGDNQSLSIGRSPDCNLVINRQWVSRRHATIGVANGRVRLAERSSSGTFLSMRSGQEILVRREDVLLLGTGIISPGMQSTNSDAQVIYFEIAML
jgi:adenylate cyclase